MTGTNIESKNYRILSIHDRLNRGDVLNKKDVANRYEVDERTIQRDIADLKSYLEKDRFKEGEFRKRVQFMFTGALKKITFKFWGDSLEAVLDQLPTAKVVSQLGKESIIEAEVYGDGVKR